MFNDELRFRLPPTWMMETTDEGGSMFYDPEPGSGVLRIDMLTYRYNDGRRVSRATAEDQAADWAAKYGADVTSLLNGASGVQYDVDSEEDGTLLQMRFWHIAQAIPPEHMRIVIISYTLEAFQVDEPKHADVLAMLDRAIAAIELAPTLA